MSIIIDGSGSISGVSSTGLTTAQTVTSAQLSGDASPIGVNQTWQSVTRNSGTTYTNSTGKSIMLCVSVQNQALATVIIGGYSLPAQYSVTGSSCVTTYIIPNASTYVINYTIGAGQIFTSELR